jgi:hypothetical protein
MAKTGKDIKFDNALSIESFVHWLAGISRLGNSDQLSIKLPECWKSVDRTQFGSARVTVHRSSNVAVVFEHSLGKFEWEFAVISNFAD